MVETWWFTGKKIKREQDQKWQPQGSTAFERKLNTFKKAAIVKDVAANKKERREKEGSYGNERNNTSKPSLHLTTTSSTYKRNFREEGKTDKREL